MTVENDDVNFDIDLYTFIKDGHIGDIDQFKFNQDPHDVSTELIEVSADVINVLCYKNATFTDEYKHHLLIHSISENELVHAQTLVENGVLLSLAVEQYPENIIETTEGSTDEQVSFLLQNGYEFDSGEINRIAGAINSTLLQEVLSQQVEHGIKLDACYALHFTKNDNVALLKQYGAVFDVASFINVAHRQDKTSGLELAKQHFDLTHEVLDLLSVCIPNNPNIAGCLLTHWGDYIYEHKTEIPALGTDAVSQKISEFLTASDLARQIEISIDTQTTTELDAEDNINLNNAL